MSSESQVWTVIESNVPSNVTIEYCEYDCGVSIKGKDFAIVIQYPIECQDRQMELSQVY